MIFSSAADRSAFLLEEYGKRTGRRAHWRWPQEESACRQHRGTVKYYAQIHLQVWQNSVCTGQVPLPLITQ